jgi:hypothetical protein
VVDRLAELDKWQVTAMACDSSGSVVALGLANGCVHIWGSTDLAVIIKPQQLHSAGAPKDSEVKSIAFSPLQGDSVDLAVVYDCGDCYTMGLRVAQTTANTAGHPSPSEAVILRSPTLLGKPTGCQSASLRHCRYATVQHSATPRVGDSSAAWSSWHE